MHLLGQRDIDFDLGDFSFDEALRYIDLLGLYLVADKPDRPTKDREGFRPSASEDRRIVRNLPNTRYLEDEFQFTPYGYHRLVPEG